MAVDAAGGWLQAHRAVLPGMPGLPFLICSGPAASGVA
jgi:hypothetical protein